MARPASKLRLPAEPLLLAAAEQVSAARSEPSPPQPSNLARPSGNCSAPQLPVAAAVAGTTRLCTLERNFQHTSNLAWDFSK
ncbi:unnamed protein product, partial [Polarella glacialis]